MYISKTKYFDIEKAIQTMKNLLNREKSIDNAIELFIKEGYNYGIING